LGAIESILKARYGDKTTGDWVVFHRQKLLEYH
jgi:hypothetical protein